MTKRKEKIRSKHPSKKEIINALLAEDPCKKLFDKYIVLVEHKKLSNKIGVVKAEVIQNGKIMLKGKKTETPVKEEEGFNWNIVEEGESHFEGYSLDVKSQSMKSMIKEGLRKSVKDGRIPFFKK